MITMKLDKPWTYRTPEVTIDYPAGEHQVFKYIAEQAVAESVIEELGDDSTSDVAAVDAPSNSGRAKK